MGFFDNYTKVSVETLGADLLQDITYESQDSGTLSIQAYFNVKEESDGEYIRETGHFQVFNADVIPRTGDEITDSVGRVWIVESYNHQKNELIQVNCYSNNEATYET